MARFRSTVTKKVSTHIIKAQEQESVLSATRRITVIPLIPGSLLVEREVTAGKTTTILWVTRPSVGLTTMTEAPQRLVTLWPSEKLIRKEKRKIFGDGSCPVKGVGLNTSLILHTVFPMY